MVEEFGWRAPKTTEVHFISRSPRLKYKRRNSADCLQLTAYSGHPSENLSYWTRFIDLQISDRSSEHSYALSRDAPRVISILAFCNQKILGTPSDPQEFFSRFFRKIFTIRSKVLLFTGPKTLHE